MKYEATICNNEMKHALLHKCKQIFIASKKLLLAVVKSHLAEVNRAVFSAHIIFYFNAGWCRLWGNKLTC